MSPGARIALIRGSKGWSQEYVAGELGLSPSSYSRLERNERSLLYSEAVKLARLFNCDVAAFDESLGGPIRSVVPPAVRL